MVSRSVVGGACTKRVPGLRLGADSITAVGFATPTPQPPTLVEEPLYFLSTDGVYMTTPDGRWVWRLVAADVDVMSRSLAVSPDGRMLAFVCENALEVVGDEHRRCHRRLVQCLCFL